MSHSVVKDFPTQTDSTLVLVVNKNGELSVDKETLDGYAKLGNSQVSILRVDNDDGSTVDMTLDTFHQTDTPAMETLTVNVEEEDELTRNYNNFRMDHCYTPLTSPSQQKLPVPPDLDSELELDDLAHTLSILDGSNRPSEQISTIKPLTNIVKVSQKLNDKEQRTETLNDKVHVLNKVNKMGVHKVYKGVKTIVKGATKVFKKAEQPLPQLESDPDDDDLNDSDFELNDNLSKFKSKRTYRRRAKLENEVNVEMRNKIVKIRKGVKHIVYKPHSPTKTAPTLPEPKLEPTPPPPVTPEPVKSPDVKKAPKKEKKIPKVVDDGIALFSTPDIIRRVGSGKQGEKVPETPDSPTKVTKPAKIEDRCKSETGRLSTDSRTKSPHRHSLDSKIDKTKIETKHSERRSSNASDKSVENPIQSNTFDIIDNSAAPVANNITPTLNIPPTENNAEPYDSISEAVGNLENPIDPAPSAEMIRSIIHNSDTKTYSTPMETQSVETPVINPVPPNVHQSQLNLEGTGLDIDQGILDNINTDELIPEDILYQVAKLVENPDVQNVIDRTLVDASLNLEPTIQPQIPQQQTSAHTVQQQPQLHQHVAPVTQPEPSQSSQIISKNTTQRPIQIVRSDGRVVILPPIEKPATRSSKKKQEPSLPPQPQVQQLPKPQIQPQQQIQQPIIQQKPHHVRPVHKQIPALEVPPEEAPVASDIESDSDESWNSEDDPDRLWCICKQPHNNRFMICCDTCEDWFHGKCVNVTKAMGQQMEQQGKEWMCPNCVKRLNSPGSTVSQTMGNTVPSKAARVPTDGVAKRKSIDSGPACIVCSAPSRANSVYCSDACILKHAQGVEKETNKAAQKNVPQRIIVFERSTGKCLSGPNAPSAANLKQWLREHPGFEVVRPANKSKQNLVQSKLHLVKNPQGKDGVSLAVNRKGVQLGVLPHSSKQHSTIKLIPAAKLNVPGMKNQVVKQINQTSPTKPVKTIQTTLKSPTASTSQLKTKPTTPTTSKVEKAPRERKQKLQSNNQTPETPKQSAQENIRDTVKKTLNEQLTTRLKEANDIKLTDDEVDKMATEIEAQLYKLFGDSGPKYRTKYRSLIFNIKDTKNQTLWRRICEKTIAPSQLVRLTPDEMASQELARWRERENKHQLDMIKKSELEMLTINRTYVLKTHKGEQVMEDRPSVKVDSTEIIPGLGADSTSEQDSGTGDKSERDELSTDRKSSKHSRRDRDREKLSGKDRSISKDRRNNKDHKSSRTKRSRSREKDRDRSSHRSDRKRSRSRDRHHRSSHKSSRHRRDKHSTEHLDKKSREILDNLENNKIVPPPEDRLWKHVPQQDILVATPDSDSDHEPSSTVTIPTPPRNLEDESQIPVAKQVEPVAIVESAEKPEQKTDPPVKTTRADPRLVRETSVETPKSESPQQPSTPTISTSPVPPAQAKFTSESKETIIWEGNINMVEVAKFHITLHEVSGDCSGLGTELPSTLEIVGRISPETVWDYIGKMRRSNSKLISVLRLTARNVEEKMPYIALYSYLSSRSRFGVIKSTNNAVKDFYIMPLASHAPVPQALLPLSGPGFEESRPHLLLGIIVRAKRKRSSPVDIIANPTTKRSRLDSPSTIPATTTAQPPRSYTPPPTRGDPRIRLPAAPTTPASNDDDEPYSPEDSDLELNTTAPAPVPPRKSSSKTASTVAAVAAAAASALNLKTADLTSLVTATLKSGAFLDTTPTVQSFEPFSNKFDAIPGLEVDSGVDSLQRKMAELDKCIEMQKEEIRSISQDIVSSGASMATNLSNISLPSNLQQILDSIKNIPSTNTGAQDTSTEEYCPTAPGYKSASDELTIPLLLPKLSSRQTDRRVPTTQTVSSDSKPLQKAPTIPLQLPVSSRESTPSSIDVALPNLTVPPPVVTPAVAAAAIAAATTLTAVASSTAVTTLSLPNTNVPPPVVLPNLTVPPPTNILPSSSSTIPLNLPKSKSKPTPVASPSVVSLTPPGTTPVVIPLAVETKSAAESKPASVLSSLSEEELIRKAAEMLGEAEPAPEEETEEQDKTQEKAYQAQNAFKSAPVMYSPTPAAPSLSKRTKIDSSQPPVPGLEDEY